MEGEVILTTPSQLKTLLVEAVSIALKYYKPPTQLGAISDEYLTVEQVCKIFQISRTTVWQLRRDGKLTARTVGRKVLFTRSDVEKAIQPVTD